MRAEIISTGTELLLGHIINTDSAFLARELNSIGISLYFMQTVGDNPERLEEAIRLALSRSDLVIISGGLGSTPDDLTRYIVAKVFNRPLVLYEDCLCTLQEYLDKSQLSAGQISQANFPDGAIVFKNAAGTAPGCAIEDKGKRLIMLPGPPKELELMWEKEVKPYLASLSPGQIISLKIKTFGMGEGSIAEKLGDLLKKENPTVATYASGGETMVKITGFAANEKDASNMLLPVKNEVLSILGDICYAYDENDLASTVVKLLIEKNLTLATAESCTGGWLSQHITACAGSSKVFHLGVVTYSNEAKEKILHVPSHILQDFGAVSPQTAIEMAKGIRAIAGNDFGIAITGIAGPDGGSEEKPVGLVWLCLADKNENITSCLEPAKMWKGREYVRLRAVKIALDMLRRKLTGKPIPEKYAG